ncbi:hypothetical protein FSP39_024664 [Pinctada imbricata]|uniref:Uncharacterized protein n=1 Tax=Pinctada imbricata TaxID=66713 RepID=A0AA88YF94_PINIB|nr:hypothetical protein FSP39_024664 [Pinctada imbricata]
MIYMYDCTGANPGEWGILVGSGSSLRNQPAFHIKARPISTPEPQLDSYPNKSSEKEHTTVSAGSIKFAWNDEKAVPNSVPPMLIRRPSEKIIENFVAKDLEDITDDN